MKALFTPPWPEALRYYPAYLSEAEQAELWAYLQSEIAWEARQIRLFGRWYWQPRLTAWYGEPEASYRYSGLDWQPRPWADSPLAALAQRLSSEFELSRPLNAVLLNLYRDGQDSMGWHADDEPELGPEPEVFSLSLGATRRFQLRPKGGKGSLSLDLEPGSLLHMGKGLQSTWQHQLPKTKGLDKARINLTFRRIHT